MREKKRGGEERQNAREERRRGDDRERRRGRGRGERREGWEGGERGEGERGRLHLLENFSVKGNGNQRSAFTDSLITVCKKDDCKGK